MDKRADGTISIPREELYAMVWETPLSRLGPTLGISGVALGKACERYQVPRPGRGYWARLQHGLKVKQTQLPVVEDEKLKIVVLYPGHPGEGPPAVPCKPPGPPIVVPERLTDPHPLVTRTAALLAKEKTGDYPTLYGRARDGALAVEVSRASLDRALRILDTLIKEVENRQWAVEVRAEGWPNGSLLLLGREKIPFRIREEIGSEERPPTNQEKAQAKHWPHPQPYYRGVSTGRLCLYFDLGYDAGIRKKWSDGRKQRIEDLLPKLMEALSQFAVAAEEKHRMWEEEARKRAEAERQRAEREARVRLEQARLQSLLDDIDKWQRAEQIRAYVSDVRRRVRQARGPKGQANIQEWVDWALSHADRMDPMVNHEPTALEE